MQEKIYFDPVSTKDVQNNIKNIYNVKNLKGVTHIHLFKKSRLPKMYSLGLPLLA